MKDHRSHFVNGEELRMYVERLLAPLASVSAADGAKVHNIVWSRHMDGQIVSVTLTTDPVEVDPNEPNAVPVETSE